MAEKKQEKAAASTELAAAKNDAAHGAEGAVAYFQSPAVLSGLYLHAGADAFYRVELTCRGLWRDPELSAAVAGARRGPWGRTRLMDAARRGDLAGVVALLAAVPPVDVCAEARCSLPLAAGGGGGGGSSCVCAPSNLKFSYPPRTPMYEDGGPMYRVGGPATPTPAHNASNSLVSHTALEVALCSAWNARADVEAVGTPAAVVTALVAAGALAGERARSPNLLLQLDCYSLDADVTRMQVLLVAAATLADTDAYADERQFGADIIMRVLIGSYEDDTFPSSSALSIAAKCLRSHVHYVKMDWSLKPLCSGTAVPLLVALGLPASANSLAALGSRVESPSPIVFVVGGETPNYQELLPAEETQNAAVGGLSPVQVEVQSPVYSETSVAAAASRRISFRLGGRLVSPWATGTMLRSSLLVAAASRAHNAAQASGARARSIQPGAGISDATSTPSRHSPAFEPNPTAQLLEVLAAPGVLEAAVAAVAGRPDGSDVEADAAGHAARALAAVAEAGGAPAAAAIFDAGGAAVAVDVLARAPRARKCDFHHAAAAANLLAALAKHGPRGARVAFAAAVPAAAMAVLSNGIDRADLCVPTDMAENISAHFAGALAAVDAELRDAAVAAGAPAAVIAGTLSFCASLPTQTFIMDSYHDFETHKFIASFRGLRAVLEALAGPADDPGVVARVNAAATAAAAAAKATLECSLLSGGGSDIGGGRSDGGSAVPLTAAQAGRSINRGDLDTATSAVKLTVAAWLLAAAGAALQAPVGGAVVLDADGVLAEAFGRALVASYEGLNIDFQAEVFNAAAALAASSVPAADALLRAGIAEVVWAAADPLCNAGWRAAEARRASLESSPTAEYRHKEDANERAVSAFGAAEEIAAAALRAGSVLAVASPDRAHAAGITLQLLRDALMATRKVERGRVQHNNIYFGSVPVAFVPVEGSVVAFDAADWAPDLDSAPSCAARAKYLQQEGIVGPPDVLLPAVPSLDLKRVRPGGAPGAAGSAVPAALAAPLIKVPIETAPAGLLRGVASGTRSALVNLAVCPHRNPGVWYRLTGCGENDEGFIVCHTPALDQPLLPGETRWRDIRGCAFPKEALCELAMASRVDAALAATGSLGANCAVGYALYGGAAQLPLGPQFAPACAIETTCGDRRLGTHVLAGFEVLLQQLATDAAPEVAAAFPAARPRVGGGVVSTDQFVEDHVHAISAAFVSPGDEVVSAPSMGWRWQVPRNETTLLNVNAAASAPAAAKIAQLERDYVARLNERSASPGLYFCFRNPLSELQARPAPLPPQFTRAGERPLAREWVRAWSTATDDAERALNKLPPGACVLGYLYARLGYDAGCIMRSLRQAGLSWGTYKDASHANDVTNGGWYSNAHSNNLVVVAPGTIPAGGIGAGRLLSALDFGMAFDGSTFVDTAAGTVGLPPAAFSRLLDYERSQMLLALSGAGAASGVPANMKPYLSRSASPGSTNISNALHDTLVLAYLAGCEGRHSDVPAFDAGLHAAAQALMRLAIIVQADYVA